MLIELRINNSDQAGQYLNLPVDVFGIGSEYCVHKVPSAAEVFDIHDQVCEKGKRLRIILPKTPQKYYASSLQFIEEISLLDIDYTFNDFGLLYGVKEIELTGSIAIGRGVSTTLASSPWFSLFVRDEKEDMKEFFAHSNMESGSKLSLLKNFGVDTIELEGIKMVYTATEVIRSRNYQVLVHLDNLLISTGRSCSNQRYYKISPPDCKSSCNDPIQIELKKKFVTLPVLEKNKEYIESTHFVVPDQEITDSFPQLQLHGTTAYRKIDFTETEHDFSRVDRVILDTKFIDYDEIAPRCVALRDLERQKQRS